MGAIHLVMGDVVIILFGHVYRVAAGQNTTFFLAKPNEKLSDLPRHPFDMEPPELCVECNQDTGEDDSLLECEKVKIIVVSILQIADRIPV